MIRIKQLREEKNIEQKQLARDLQVSQPTISDWETGRKKPSSKSVEMLADYFGVSLDYLLERSENRRPDKENSPSVEELFGDDVKGLAIYNLYQELPPEAKLAAEKYLEFLLQSSGEKENK